MTNNKEAICVGCNKKAGDMEEYNDECPVQDDGTYQNNKFVCTNCYCKLIPYHLDIGNPSEIQNNMIQFKTKEPK